MVEAINTKMKIGKTKILVAIVVVLIIQLGCKVTQQSYPKEMPTPIMATVPKILARGEEYKFSIETSSGVQCHAAIAYYDLEDKWTITELPTIESGKNGVCEWSWKIPEDAKDGVGEFRGNVQNKEESTNTFPVTFCIGQCPQ